MTRTSIPSVFFGRQAGRALELVEVDGPLAERTMRGVVREELFRLRTELTP